MKDLKFYIPTHPGAESQFKVATARLRVAEEEGEFRHFPASYLAGIVGSKGWVLSDLSPYFGSSDTRQVATLTTGHTGTLSYVAESGSSPGGHKFLSNASPAAGDEMMLTAVRAMLIQGTSGGDLEYSDAYVFSTQLQVSSIAASGMGFACGWIPQGASTSPVTAAPANGLWFEYNPNGANTTVQFKTVQNSGTVHAIDGTTNQFNLPGGTTGSFTPTAAADLRATILFGESKGGNTWGGVYIGNYTAGSEGGRFTPFTAAQVSDLSAMITAANVYLSPFVAAYVAGSTQRSMYMQNAMGFADK